MTSTTIVRSEIVRFLQTNNPEVICISGVWGVGKTFTWQAGVDEVKAAKSCGLKRYSYVTLFGINSLEALKLALVGNLEFWDPTEGSALQKGFHYLRSISSQATKWNELASTIPYIGGLVSKAGPLYFSFVHHQLICIDDIERRGKGLELKDVFGLVTFLREQRGCKIALLLNIDELAADDKKDFDTFFEKVIDAHLIFAPTAGEATQIALPQHDPVSTLLRKNCEILNISNIRVIKKLERLVQQILPELKDCSPELRHQTIHALTLFGWSKFQPHLAPPPEFYRTSSTARYLEAKAGKKLSRSEENWDALLTQYCFSSMDEFDGELMKFVDAGVFDRPELRAKAAEQDQKIQAQKRSGSFEKAWRPFHDSFDSNIEEVTTSILEGMKANIDVVSLPNLDTALALLKELGKATEAHDLLKFYEDRQPVQYWDASSDPFHRKLTDPDVLAAASAAQKKLEETPFDFETALLEAGTTYNSETIKKLAGVPVEEYYKGIKSRTGEEMRRFIFSALNFRKILNANDEMLEVARRMEEALKQIGAESNLNAVRVSTIRRYRLALRNLGLPIGSPGPRKIKTLDAGQLRAAPPGNHSSPAVPWRSNRNARSISTFRSSLVGTKV